MSFTGYRQRKNDVYCHKLKRVVKFQVSIERMGWSVEEITELFTSASTEGTTKSSIARQDDPYLPQLETGQRQFLLGRL